MDPNHTCIHGFTQNECYFCNIERMNRVKIENGFRKLLDQYELDGPEIPYGTPLKTSIDSPLVKGRNVLEDRLNALKQRSIHPFGIRSGIKPISLEEQIGIRKDLSINNRNSKNSIELDASIIGKTIGIADPHAVILKKRED